MLFDKLCGLAERHLPHLIPILDQAALFHFPGRPHEFLTAQRDQIDYDQANELFYLPFPVVALEDDASVCILMDSEEGQLGLEGRRHFVDMMSTKTDAGNFNWSYSRTGVRPEEAAGVQQDFVDRFNNPYIMNCGYLEDMHYQSGSRRLVSY